MISFMQNVRPHLQAIRPIHSRSKVFSHLKRSDIQPMEPRKIAVVHNAVLDAAAVVDNPLTYTEPVSTTQQARSVTTALPGATHCGQPDDKIIRALEISSTTSITPRLPTLQHLQDAMAVINNRLTFHPTVPTGMGKDMDDTLRDAYVDGLMFGLVIESLNITNKGSYPAVYNRIGDLLSNGEGGTKSDFSTAMRWYRRAAKEDDPQGQYNVAKMYEYGFGVPQDISLAMHWYLKAESKGHILAQVCIGDIYAHGVGGFAEDYSEAMKWYLKAEESGQGSAMAEFKIARMYELGQGVSKDESVASMWFQRTSKHGDENNWALCAKAFTFLNGVGVPKDLTKAFEYMLKAAQKGLMPIYEEIGAMYFAGQGTPQDYEQARSWFLKSAHLGHPVSQYYLGIMYSQGRGVPIDDKTAFEWFLKSAEQGTRGRNMYMHGKGVPQVYEKALEWFLKAAQKGDAAAQHSIGSFYAFGRGGVPRDFSITFDWVLKSAQQGYRSAQLDLGFAYKAGLGTSQNDIKAVEWFRKSAEQGDAVAQVELGNAYLLGKGVGCNVATAKKWFHLAAEQGNEEAQALIQQIQDQAQ
ncbi:hypothetical protein BGZ88_001346 [Linnemannia elongata]|nr:hypothetical protein BGZ88_001346 [Linnemannia elongata]